MLSNPAVVYSFFLYVLYVLLPLIPAVLIFRLFPDTKVTVSGPLQNLTVNATGAFAAYVVTAALGFFLVKGVEEQIVQTRLYPVQGVIVDLEQNQVLDSDQFYSRYASETFNGNGQFATKQFYFVVLLDHPVEHPETISLKFWDNPGASGVGAPPAPQWVPMKLMATNSSPQRFRLRHQATGWLIESEK
jgi:hypothetical protein